jgi:hypothetical protein
MKLTVTHWSIRLMTVSCGVMLSDVLSSRSLIGKRSGMDSAIPIIPVPSPFDIDDDSFDRLVTPQCTKMIRGTWTYALTAWTYVKDAGADINDPSDFVRAEDYLGRPQKFLLKADGTPCLIEGTEDGTDPDEPAKVLIERYDEANFLTLGIPTVF